jgi:hypothetical protein
LVSEYPNLSVIGALMYLANNIRPDIIFAVNLLERYIAASTMRHWNGVNDVLRYLQGIPDLGLFYKKNQDLSFIGYVNAGYLSDPIMVNLRQASCFHMEGLLFHKSFVNRL